MARPIRFECCSDDPVMPHQMGKCLNQIEVPQSLDEDEFIHEIKQVYKKAGWLWLDGDVYLCVCPKHAGAVCPAKLYVRNY